MTDTEPPVVPPLYWDGCQFYADAGKGTHYVDAPYEGRYAVTFLTSSGHWAYQGNVDELPEAVMRLNLPTDIAAGAVPDTGQAREPGADWAARPRRFSPEDTLSVAERLGAAEPSGGTVQAPDVADLAYARSEVDKWLADNDPYCILPTRTEHIPALLARLDDLEGTR